MLPQGVVLGGAEGVGESVWLVAWSRVFKKQSYRWD